MNLIPEYDCLERILLDAISEEPIAYINDDLKSDANKSKYKKYKTKDYTPTKHEYIE